VLRHYCTYFDIGYATRGLCLYRSLKQHATPFLLHVLCLDDAVLALLEELELPEVRLLSLADLEAAYPELASVKATRTRIEYYFTLSPVLPLHLLERSGMDLVTYLDADLFFYGSPEPLFLELGEGSILIPPHRLAPRYRELERTNGRFNVGVLSFRNDERGLACLRWWRERCLEWCYDRREPGRYADQKYLDEWPERFDGVVISTHPGINLAPWNLVSAQLWARRGEPWVGGAPLIFFHFHGFKQTSTGLYETGLEHYRTRLTSNAVELIYQPYVREWRSVERDYGLHTPGHARLSKLSGLKGLLQELGAQRLLVVGPYAAAIRLSQPLRWLRGALSR
jgi:hypothetical protein